MDVIKLLKNVDNINNYISITEHVINNYSELNIQCNMSTVLALKNSRSIEIDFFNKCYESGAALILFEMMLREPPCNKWGVVGKELVGLIQYWLEALRKNLVIYNTHWWNLMNILLKCIQKIYLKHATIINLLVDKTGECLLDLASRSEPSLDQRYEIIQCFNKFCSASSRQLRYELKAKFQRYFTLLSLLMADCGDFRMQYAIIETLMRWLVPRDDLKVRQDAAAKWLSSPRYSSQAVNLFLQQSWIKFFRDARRFLNTHNDTNTLVISILCRKLFIGNRNIITVSRDYWLDLNCGSKCVSLILDAILFKALNVSPLNATISNALVITEDNTNAVEMYRQSNETLITLKIADPLKIYSSKVLENQFTVKAIISSKSNLHRVDKALRTIFDKKYQLIMNIDSAELPWGDEDNSRIGDYISEEDTRFSNPPEILRQKLLEQRAKASRQSPSSISTSSLVLLKEKLSDYPKHFDKEIEKVSANPQLQSIAEDVEREERQSYCSLLSTARLGIKGISSSNRSSEEEEITQNNLRKKEMIKDNENIVNVSSDKSVDSKNIVDLLAQEALQYRPSEDTRKTEIRSRDDLDNTPYATKNVRHRRCDKKEYNYRNTLITDVMFTDDSNTAFVENTPAAHIKGTKQTSVVFSGQKNSKTFDNREVEDFFSQHFAENRQGDLVISPTLAKLINCSRSSSRESFVLRPPTNIAPEFLFKYVEIVECLNAIIDEVCKHSQKHIQYSGKMNTSDKDITEIGLQTVPLVEVNKLVKENKKKLSNKGNKRKSNKGIKLKYTNTKKKVTTRGTKNNNNLVLKISPIIEKEKISDGTVASTKNVIPKLPTDDKTSKVFETLLSKRKRKLYSTKDDDLVNVSKGIHISETEEDNSVLSVPKVVNQTPISNATSYKELEKIRKRSTRQLRNRKSECLSPKTKNINNMFDNLKKTVENEDKIVLVNKSKTDLAVYNFTSGSEDDDFKTNKAVNKRNNTTNVSYSNKTRRGRSKAKIDSDSNYHGEHILKTTKRANSKRQRGKQIQSPKPLREMVDERMRDATAEVLNVSFIMEPDKDKLDKEPEPTHKKPRIITIGDEEECEIITVPVKKNKRQNKNQSKSSKKRKLVTGNKLVATDETGDREKTISPLPGLVIETVQPIPEPNDSITVGMLKEFKDICEKSNFQYRPELTQNLLSDSETVNDSPPQLNTTDEFRKFGEEYFIKKKNPECKVNKKVVEADRIKRLSSVSVDVESANNEIIVVLDKLDLHSELSVPTLGNSPITAHGDLDERPPNVNDLNEKIPQRGLELENFNDGMVNYYDKLLDKLNLSNSSSNNSVDSQYKNVHKYQNIFNSPKKQTKKLSIKEIVLNKSPTVSVTKLSPIEIRKWLAPQYNDVFDAESSESLSLSELSAHTIRKRETKRRISDEHKVSDNICASTDKNEQNIRTSAISPIMLYEEYKKKLRKKKEKKSYLTATNSENSQIQTYKYQLRSAASHAKDKNLLIDSNVETSTDKDDTDSKMYNDVNNKKRKRSYDSKNPKVVVEPIADENVLLKRSIERSPIFLDSRKPSTQLENIIASGRSGSSVDDWFRRNLRVAETSKDNIKDSVNESLINIMEKLDTTLTEIHDNTNRSIVKLIGETEMKLNNLGENRQQLYKEVAKEIITAVVGIVDEKFSDLDRRSKQKEDKLKSEFKAKAQDIIHTDSKRKRVMVKLLKEDIQAVLDRNCSWNRRS